MEKIAEELIDYAPAALGLLIIFISVRKAVLEGWNQLALYELITGILICAVSLYLVYKNNKSGNKLQEGINELIRKQSDDSIANEKFQKYLKDTFGIQKNADTAIISNHIVYNSKTINNISSLPLSANPSKELPDSINYFYKISKDTFFVAPKEGVWGDPIILWDTSMHPTLDMGAGNTSPRVIKLNNRTFVTNYIFGYTEKASMEEPFRIIPGKQKIKYLIFGDDVLRSKRYLYENGKVTWIPTK